MEQRHATLSYRLMTVLHEKGLISDSDYIDLRWPNQEQIDEALEKIT